MQAGMGREQECDGAMTIEDATTEVTDGVAATVNPPERVLDLISELCRSLDAEGIQWCHWKSNESLHRSASGENDLDLLVEPSDADRFEAVLRRLGFERARLPGWKEVPGVWHAYGLDRATVSLVHIHAHRELIVGDDMTKNYRLPIEAAYVGSAVRAEPFLVPAPEYELAVFLVRMVIKHCTWDAIVSRQGALTRSERRELADLLARVDEEDVWRVMERHLPFIPRELRRHLLRAVQRGTPAWFKIRTARRLQRALAGFGRRRGTVDTYLKLWRRGRAFVGRRFLGRPPERKRLGERGRVIALIGGDGAGKSTAVEDLSGWLGAEFVTVTFHLGKPPRSALSTVVKGLMTFAASFNRSGVASGPALRASLEASDAGSMDARTWARLVWEILTARDRYRTYRRVRRAASRGALVICDRYPLPQLKLMDGPVSARMSDPARWGPTVKRLADLEKRIYARIRYPDRLIVLRVPPDVAVSRRGDERESFLRPRSEEVWQRDWSRIPATVIEADLPIAEVRSAIRSAVWSALSSSEHETVASTGEAAP